MNCIVMENKSNSVKASFRRSFGHCAKNSARKSEEKTARGRAFYFLFRALFFALRPTERLEEANTVIILM